MGRRTLDRNKAAGIRQRLHDLAAELWNVAVEVESADTAAKRKALADHLEALQDEAYRIADENDRVMKTAPGELEPGT